MSCKMCKGKRSIWKLLFGFIPWPVPCPACGGRSWFWYPSPPQPAPRSNWTASPRRVQSYPTTNPQIDPGLPLIVDPFDRDAPDDDLPPDVPVAGEEPIADPNPGGATDETSDDDTPDEEASDDDAADQDTSKEGASDPGTAY
jgi:hypothetical protein